jgi:hypothetical protein
MRQALLMLLILGPVSGCFLDGFHKDDPTRNASLPKVPPALVAPDQVHAKNAHEQATALFDEIEYDESQSKQRPSTSGSK